MVNVVRLILRRILAHLQDVADDFNEIMRREQRVFDPITLRLAHFDIELQTPDAREIKLARVEEHAFEQAIRGLHGRRIAGAHLAIDFQQRINRLRDDILLQSLREHRPQIVSLREED